MANLSEKISFIQEYIANQATNRQGRPQLEANNISENPNRDEIANFDKLHQDNLKLRQIIVKSEKIIANSITQIQDLTKNG